MSNGPPPYTKPEWRHLIAHSLPTHIPTLPKTTLDDLKRAGREEVVRMYGSRNWEFCLTCKRPGAEYVLKKCGGCGAFPGNRALYCSRKCQREGWPMHKHHCADAALLSMRLAVESGVSISVWKNTNKLSKRRNEGMRLILKWALDQTCLSNPPIDWETTCLTIYCRSRRDGKGPVSPKKFHLQPIPRGTPTPAEYLAALRMSVNAQGAGGIPSGMIGRGTRMALVQVYIDNLPQEPCYTPLEYPAPTSLPPTPPTNNDSSAALKVYYIPQWPWIFATVLRMQNHNAELAKFRLDLLIPYVEALIKEGKVDVLRFRAPVGLGGREGWVLYDLEKWQSIFGECIEV